MTHFEQIDAYLSGEMNAEEKALFEQQLQQDALLKKDYEDWLLTAAIVEKHETAEKHIPTLINTLEPLTKKYFGEQHQASKGRVVSIKKYIYTAMAAAAIIIAVFLIPGGGIDSYDVAPIPGALVRGETNTTNTGAQLFNEAHYKEALPYLKEAALTHPDDATANFYYGITLLKTKQPAMALPLFEKIAKGSSAYAADSYFFAALAAYKTDNKQLAAKYAQKVPQTNTNYKKAQKILRKSN